LAWVIQKSIGTKAIPVKPPVNLSGNLGVAFPLTRDSAAPVYGGQGRDPRFLLEIPTGF